MKVLKNNLLPLCVLTYLAGFLVTPGLFWHRACATETPSDRLTCTAYATLVWPAALTGVGLFLVAKAIFFQWAPTPLSQKERA